MNKVTAQEIMKALVLDPEFASQPKKIQEAIQPYFEVLPEILEDLLPQQVNLKNLSEAKLRFLRYAIEKGYIQTFVENSEENSFGSYNKESFSLLFTEVLNDLIEAFTNLVNDCDKFLEENEITEEQVILNPKFGLQSDLVRRYKANDLTINDILRYQPAIIVRNK